MNAAGLFPKPKSDAAKRLAQLAARHNELRAEARDLRAREAADAAARTDLTKDLHAAQARDRAFGDASATVKSTQAKLTKLETTATGRAEETRVVTDAVGTVEAELERHARAHANELMAELTADAVAAAERLSAAVREMKEAHTVYAAAGNRAEALLRIVDADRLRAERLPPIPASLIALAQDPGATSIPVPVLGAPDSSVVSAA